MTRPDIQRFKLSGLSCAGCVAKAEKSLLAVDGVRVASVNLAERTATVEGSANPAALINALESKGFQATPLLSSEQLHFSIPDMSCAGCVARIEKALNEVSGVYEARVNLSDKTAEVDGVAEVADVLLALEAIGKPGSLIDAEQNSRNEQEAADKQRYRYLLRHSAIALTFSLPLMVYMLFGSMSIQSGKDQWLWGVAGLLSLGILCFSGGHYFKGMWQNIKHRSASMDTLIALGTGTAWLYSITVVLFPQWFPEAARHVYFEASAMIIGLINLGHAMELRARGKTGEAIKRLLNLQAKTARVVREGKEIDLPVEAVRVNDLICVRPGEQVPVDGVVIEGSSFIDESMLTGEPLAVSKQTDDRISAGTLNKNGSLLFKAEQVGKDTALARIINRVKQAQNSKMPIARLADQIASVFVPVVIAIAILAAMVWYLVGPEPRIAHMMVVATTVLIIACPCALGLATPMSIMVGVGRAAELGILVRNGEALQKASQLTTVVLDKTGTITQGQPVVTDILTLNTYTEQQLLGLAAALETGSEHPLGEAIINSAKDKRLLIPSLESFQAITGQGVVGTVDDQALLLGNHKLMQEHQVDIDSLSDQADVLAEQGKTPIFLAIQQQLAGIIAVADPVREDSVEAIQRLQHQGIKVIMLTGDNQKTAQAVAKQVGVNDFQADCMPEDKEAFIRQLQEQGEKTGMTGDGINDAPALARADVGFALGTGTDIAIETAEITLMRASLHGLADSIELSKATLINIKQNLLGAFVYNSLGIPVAAGVLYPLTGMLLNPVVAGAAMALSSVTVVSNANRLRLFRCSYTHK